MSKVMIFVDGSWLYANTPRLGQVYGADYKLDFGRLPRVLGKGLGEQISTLGGASGAVDVVRTFLFGSCAANYDLRDDALVQKRREFYDLVREEYHFETEIFPINYRGRRVRKADRNPSDTFEPEEKCVDIAMAASILYYAAQSSYDIAIVVLGDRDFMPVLRHVRNLGKRVAIASIKGSCAGEYADPTDEARVRDFSVIWLDELLADLELKYERHQLKCESELHKGQRLVWTEFHPRKGQRFYCDSCRAEIQRQKEEIQARFVGERTISLDGENDQNSWRMTESIRGIVTNVGNHGYGFARGADGHDYFFHSSDLRPPLEFSQISVGDELLFEVKREPARDKAGAAQNVRRSVDSMISK
ncbi:MAG TPA: NYN domain-containing protein [Candidatus Acidoferrum sp.]|nr:NYN domain-containing protein [Candidatus Acidoferrum sp.]